MAEPLNNHFGDDIPRIIADMILSVAPAFPADEFVRSVLDGYADLALMDRGRKIARALHRHLPEDYDEAIEILLASLAQAPAPRQDGSGMAAFLFLPHTMFVGEFGLPHFETSMRAQFRLTQVFTAEFSIRPFLMQHPEATLDRLRVWATDPNRHVRRLVSEGSRPRLPWAPRLPAFQADPRPVLELLDILKDDPELYVRRSVANNLNDIGKDHPTLLAETAARWMGNAPERRRWVIRHGLRSAVKHGDAQALAVLGFSDAATVAVEDVAMTPSHVPLGAAVTLEFLMINTGDHPQRVLVDWRVHFVKSNGKTSPKVFKGKILALAPQETLPLRKTISLAEMTTRRHYAGTHRVDVLVNGRPLSLGTFEVG